MMVTNDLVHDVRVVKEARTLRSAGVDVTILATTGPGLPTHEHVDGIEVMRLPLHTRELARAVVAALLSWCTPWLRMVLAPRAHDAGRTDSPTSESVASSRVPQILSFLAFNATLARVACTLRPDLIHAHDLTTLLATKWVKRLTGSAVVYDSHELFLHRNTGAKRRWLNHAFWSIIERRCATRAGSRTGIDGFITVNNAIAAHLNEQYRGLPPAVIVRNATIRSEAPVHDDGRLHNAAGLDRSKRILLFQGSIAPQRGLETIVQSGARLPSEWAIVIMGWGAYRSELEAIARRSDRDGSRVRFIGPAPMHELRAWTAGATIGVIPYENTCLNHRYCSPNKLWEYPAAGVPVLVSPFLELRRAVETYGIGRLLPDPFSPDDVARAIASLGDDQLERMREACHRFIAAEHWDIDASRLIDLYSRLLRRELAGEPTSCDTKTPQADEVMLLGSVRGSS